MPCAVSTRTQPSRRLRRTPRVIIEFFILAVALNGFDALVFTNGIGENSARVRSRVCRGVAWIGIRRDDDANQKRSSRLSDDVSKVAVGVIATNDELIIANHSRRVLGLCGVKLLEIEIPVIFRTRL